MYNSWNYNNSLPNMYPPSGFGTTGVTAQQFPTSSSSAPEYASYYNPYSSESSFSQQFTQQLPPVADIVAPPPLPSEPSELMPPLPSEAMPPLPTEAMPPLPTEIIYSKINRIDAPTMPNQSSPSPSTYHSHGMPDPPSLQTSAYSQNGATNLPQSQTFDMSNQVSSALAPSMAQQFVAQSIWNSYNSETHQQVPYSHPPFSAGNNQIYHAGQPTLNNSISATNPQVQSMLSQQQTHGSAFSQQMQGFPQSTGSSTGNQHFLGTQTMPNHFGGHLSTNFIGNHHNGVYSGVQTTGSFVGNSHLGQFSGGASGGGHFLGVQAQGKTEGIAQPAQPFQEREIQGLQTSKPCFDSLATTLEASALFSSPGRSSRPRKIAIILRGLPGSGKSRVARAIRDMEVASGASAPKIHSLDDYFMTEVERTIVQEEKLGNGSVVKRKKQVTELEYVYEAEMEESYSSSLLKGLARTAQEGRFNCIIVDSCNIKVQDFAQQYNVLKARGYECYILQPSEMDPKVCHARNVHGRSAADVERLGSAWEATPPLYTRLSAASLFPDDTPATDITEVDMDTDQDDIAHHHQPAAAAAATPGGGSDSDSPHTPGTRSAGPPAHSAGKSRRARDRDSDSEGEEEEADEDAALASTGRRNGTGNCEESQAAAASLGLSRWEMDSRYDDDDDEKADTKKKRKPSANDRTGSGEPAAENAAQKRAGKKRVRWVDEEEEREASKGFRIGSGKKQRQLEEVFVLSGLGPPKEEIEENAAKWSLLSEGRFGLVEHHTHPASTTPQ